MISPIYSANSWKKPSLDRWQSNWMSSKHDYLFILFEDRSFRDWVNFFFFVKQRECFKKLSGIKKKHKDVIFRVLKKRRELTHTINLRRLRRKCTNKALNWSVSRIFIFRNSFELNITIFMSLWLVDNSWLEIRSKCSEWIKSQIKNNFSFFILKKIKVKIIWLNTIKIWLKGIFFSKKSIKILKKEKYSMFKHLWYKKRFKLHLRLTKSMILNRHKYRFWRMAIKKNKLCYLLINDTKNKHKILSTIHLKKNEWLNKFFFKKNSFLHYSYLYIFYKDFYKKRTDILYKLNFNFKQNIYLNLFRPKNISYYLKLKLLLNKSEFWSKSSKLFNSIILITQNSK